MDAVAAGDEPFLEELELGGFSGSVDTLDGDQQPAIGMRTLEVDRAG
jgi:hypothetical protein